ncbi:glycoside hydrolase family 15 [Cellulomonas palmilytica]|uniref:glycoside hydrolase family 15 n=1 Tax=Cellulomonas palmilytica TaxID=2608402 RepID=UPI001F2760BD|nr:glycoside hydrolase family 15 [Cellulomonas palmilytica]UJP40965.1 glycoside hydrolase family 15 [Cellulomonas palmilytica]
MPGDDARTSRSRRRTRLVAGALTAAGAVAAAVLPVSTARPAAATTEPAALRYAVIGLHQTGVALAPDGSVVELPTDADVAYLDGTRVLDPRVGHLESVLRGDAGAPGFAAAQTLADEQAAWLAQGTVPGEGGPYEDLARDALLDLRTLLLPGGAAVAGWSHAWRYVWPRDASFVAVALARTGHTDDALDVLGFLADVQGDDGGFEARYLPDGSGPPDARTPQTDGQGWAMWAAGLVLDEVPAGEARTAAAQRLAPLVARAVDGTATLLGADGLPPASPDYWERDETRLTLGTVAPLVAGLEQAVGVLREAGDDERATLAHRTASTARAAAVDAFGPAGWTRYTDGADHDAASAFVLAPFWRAPAAGGRDAWLTSVTEMSRPLGVAPAGEWRRDGVTWTPQTTLYAWVAAENGEDDRAHAWLAAIDTHRTSTGSVPEKILADGRPAAVAPLTWSAACALLAIDALDR